MIGLRQMLWGVGRGALGQRKIVEGVEEVEKVEKVEKGAGRKEEVVFIRIPSWLVHRSFSEGGEGLGVG